jgi:small conductance mechanosensitive channel
MSKFINELGELMSNISVKYLVTSLLILLAAIIVSKILRFFLNRFIRLSSFHVKVDPTRYSFIKNAVSFLVYLVAFITIFILIPPLKSLGLTLFAGAGLLTAILIFASQQAVANIISGIFIVASRPFRVDDIIKIGELKLGKVEDITLRHTVIRDFENRRIIIPNSVLSSEIIINSTIKDEEICNFVEFSISYDSDVDRAIKIIQQEAVKHPNFMDHRSEDEKKEGKSPVRVRMIGFGESSVNLRAFVWTKDHSSGFVLKCDLFKSVKEQFDKQGIEIPFPYRTLVFKNQPGEGTKI